MNAKLTRLVRRLRPSGKRQTSSDELAEAKLDARTHDMLGGKGLSPTGKVMDFERDSRSP